MAPGIEQKVASFAPRTTLALLGLLNGLYTHAGELELAGWVAADLRGHPDEAQFVEQSDDQFIAALVLSPTLNWTSEDRTDELVVKPFVRLDSVNDGRAHNDIRELMWSHFGDGWDLGAGIGKAYWGAAESWPLTDVINQTDRVEDVLGRARLGQPMVRLSLYPEIGKLEFYILPYFRERTFAEEKDRLRIGIPIRKDARYESGDKEKHLDVAARWEGTIGSVDVGAGYFHGTSRDPQLVPEAGPTGAEVIPFYWQMDQLSVDAQWPSGSWLWKFEGLARNTAADDFHAMILGFEYGQGQVFQSPADVAWMVEYIYDTRDLQLFPTPVNKDLFLGCRIQLNNTADTSAIAGVFVDIETQVTFAGTRVEHRLADSWKLEFNALLGAHVEENDLLASFSQDGFLEVRIFRYF